MNTDKLTQYGIDYNKGLQNCLGKEDFYKRILKLFLNDSCFSRASQAYADKNYALLFSCVHEMKGFTGNAALTGLYTACCALVESLRHQIYNEEEIARLFAVMQTAYDKTYEGVIAIIAE